MIKHRKFGELPGDVVCDVLYVAPSTYDKYEQLGIFQFEDEYNALELPLNEYSICATSDEYKGMPTMLVARITRAKSRGAELLHIYKRKNL